MSNVAKAESSSFDDQVINEVTAVVTQLTGIQLGPKQREMVVTRMKQRLRELECDTFAEYQVYFKANRDVETQSLISLLTTHHTFFFREFTHFEFLSSTVIPKLIPIVRARPDKTFRIWSAACSRGQEVYSLAMYFKHVLAKAAPDLSFKILGSDVDPQSVKIGQNGVYHRGEIKEAPLSLISDHFARGTGDIADYVKVKAGLKAHCSFEVGNLVKMTGAPTGAPFDVIFCRNVFIYFTKEQIRDITHHLMSALSPDGFLFVGLSESLTGMNLPLRSASPSVYVRPSLTLTKPQEAGAKAATPAVARAASPAPLVEPPKTLRVLCVDDSASIHALMKQIFPAGSGFEIIGKALNGIEAAKQVAALKPDVMTLDIHMPEQTGIEYLEKNFKSGHPPVIMVTSVSRDNADLALRALKAGASDYVEKPALSNLSEKGEEIRNKLRWAWKSKDQSASNMSLDQSFGKQIEIKNPEKKARIIVLSLGDQQKVIKLFSEFKGTQCPTYLLFDGVDPVLPKLAEDWSAKLSKKVEYWGAVGLAAANQIVVGDIKKLLPELKSRFPGALASISVCGEVSQSAANEIVSWSGAQLLLEDLGGETGAKHLNDVATDVVPVTSFAYMSSEFLGKSDA